MDTLNIEIAYAKPDQQALCRAVLPPGATIRQAIEASGILDRCPDIALEQAKVGIYGKLARLDAPVRDRDRVEIYRPLLADPKEIRKMRAAQGKVMKKGGGEASV
jgi:putative ubiquitin-RnfH superfamily antitoxin RatB of RatAB toxin-antitoxin module